MVNIKDYNSTVAGFRPTDAGVDAAAQAGRRANAAFSEAAGAVSKVSGAVSRVGSETRELGSETTQVGNEFATNMEQGIRYAGKVAVDYMDHRDISQGSAAYAKLMDRMTNEWNKIVSDKNTDPNDPTIAQKFRENVLQPELDTFQKGFLTDAGQQWAQARTTSFRDHMVTKTMADMGSLAAEAAKVNIRATVNGLSNTAMLDPSSVAHLLKEVDGTVGTMVDTSPNLRGVEGAKLRGLAVQQAQENIVKYGAIGAIQKSANPEATADEWARKYPDLINGAEVKMLAANARQQMRAIRQDSVWADHQQKLQAQDQSDQKEVEWLKRLYSDDPAQQSEVTSKAIVNDPTLNRTAKERTLGLIRREMQPETERTISNDTFVNLVTKIRNGEVTDMNPLFDARTRKAGSPGSMTKQDFLEARGVLMDMQTPEGSKLGQVQAKFMKGIGPLLDRSTMLGVDPSGGRNKYEFETFVSEQVAKAKRDHKNPFDLFNPGSPEYLGKDATVKPYISTMQERTDRVQQFNMPGPAQRRPGETVDQYRERVGR